jgi:hypothetical protein
MKRGAWMLALGLAAAAAAAQSSETTPKPSEPTAKPTPAPFYRQYLVPGNPLDDKIVEQEHRVEANPDDANLRNDFGNLLALRRFPKEAAEQYEKALHLDKKNFISAYNLGLVRETEGKLSEAISAYQRSIKRKPGFPLSRFRLGRAYEHDNQPEEAVKEYAAAMWIDPGIRDAKRNPLVIDSELIYLASLVNYQRDMAVASMDDAHVYFDNDRFRKLPVDRAISSKEVEPEDESEPVPRNVGAGGSTGATGVAEPPVRRGQRAPAAPGSETPQPGTMRGVPRPAPGAARAKTPPRAAQPFQPAPAPTPPPETVEPPPEVSPEAPPPESAPEPATTPPQEVEPS